jgi:hypothetical protein
MSSINDDVRLPFSVLDPMVGDVFSVRWEPEMMGETGNALRILSTEVLSQVGTTVLQFTVLTGLMSAISMPLRELFSFRLSVISQRCDFGSFDKAGIPDR